MNDKRYKVGLRVTGAYMFALATYALVQRDAVMAMTPNELGDALAGAASPLAFLWLVLGYLQQGEELRQNTEALRLQAEELRQSVAQQEQLVVVAREQLAEERRRAAAALEPSLRLSARSEDSPYGNTDYVLEIHNFGGTCTQLQLVSSSMGWYPSETAIAQLGKEKPWSVTFSPVKRKEEAEEQFGIELFGVTADNRAFKAIGLCEFHLVGKAFELVVLTYRPEIDIGE